MSKSTLKSKIEEIRKELISQEADYVFDMNGGTWGMTFMDTGDVLADAVDDMCNCDVSMTEWYQENFSRISAEEIVEKMMEINLMDFQEWYQDGDKVTVNMKYSD